MTLHSKLTVYVAIAGTFALMGGIVFYASLDNVDLDLIEIKLANVELREVDTVTNQAKFQVTFLVTNPSDKTLTVSQIDYKLYSDGELLGSGLYSTADIALPGRALFYSGAEIPLKNTFVLSKSEINLENYENAINERLTNFSTEGKIITQTSWSETEKDFKTGY